MSKTKVLSCFVVFLLFVSIFFAVGKGKKADVTYFNKTDAVKETVLQKDEHLYYSKKSRKKMKLIHTSEMTKLYFDEETGSVAVYDTASEKLWRSIPEVYGSVKTGAISVTVLSKGAEYTLYSQGDSQIQYEIGENYVKVLYNFDAFTDEKNKAVFTVPVVYTLDKGMLSAELDCSSIENEKRNIIIKSISLLPFFGADRKTQKGDYLLVPDGSGVKIDLSENPESFDEISTSVYGADISLGNDETSSALMGAFGMKKDESAFVCIIEEGEEFAVIKADKALSEEGLNRVGATFEITPTAETEKGRLAVSKKAYEGKIKLSYRFLSSLNADYVGMASAVREVLIRNGSLPMSKGETQGDYPFNLSIIGVGYDEASEQNRILTSYSQAYDILSSLKAKGIGEINLRLRGLFEGGVNQRDIQSADFAVKNGEDFEELTAYAKAQKVNLFADVKLISSSVKGKTDSKTLSVFGEYSEKAPDAFEMYESSFGSPYKIEKSNAALLSKMRETAFEGICLADAGKYLYSDFSKGKVALRNSTAEILSKQLSSVAANKKLMVDRGNLYSVKYADAVVDLPSESSYENRELCESVPFVQAVYHGFFDYSLSSINGAKGSETMFLRTVEYGGVPYFEWYYADSSTEESKDKYCYTNSINEAQLYYQRMSSSLSDLRNARITAHEKVKKNVYMTEYEGSTKVYVNYNKTAVTVSGVTIEPRSFVRVG